MNKRVYFISLLVFLFAVVIRLDALRFRALTVDSCIYLDIARNIAQGRGLVVSYNNYQFWQGPFYPLPVFLPPLFPIILAPIWKLFNSIEAAMFLNIFIGGLNCALIFLILRGVYKNIVIALWSVILIYFSAPMFLTSVNIWTEQLHLLFLLISVFICFRNLKFNTSRMFILGVILGFSFLIKALVYNIVIFLIFIFMTLGVNKKSLRVAGCLILGFLTIMAPYQIFCIFRFHAFYPQYFKVNTCGYLRVLELGGHYAVNHIPVLKANTPTLNFIITFAFRTIPRWIILSALMLFVSSGGLFCILLLRLFPGFLKAEKDKGEIRTKERLFIVFGVFNFLFNALTFYWHPWFSDIEIIRFNLLTYVFFVPVAIAYFYNRFHRKFYYLTFVIMLTVVLIDYLGVYKNIDFYRDRENKEMKLAFSWLQHNTGPNDIVAVSYPIKAFEMSRPIVSLPPDNIVNAQNMRKFIAIYRPKYFLIAQNSFSVYKGIINEFADKEDISQDLAYLYTIYKPR